jgi:hypothetical protein
MFLVLSRPYHTLLFLMEEKDIHDVPCVVQALPHAAVLVEEKDIPDVPCVVQALPHAAVPGGGEGYP